MFNGASSSMSNDARRQQEQAEESDNSDGDSPPSSESDPESDPDLCIGHVDVERPASNPDGSSALLVAGDFISVSWRTVEAFAAAQGFAMVRPRGRGGGFAAAGTLAKKKQYPVGMSSKF